MKKLVLPFCLALLASCQQPSTEMVSADRSAENMAMLQRFYDEVFNAHNPALLDSFCDPDMVDYQSDAAHPDGVRGIENIRSVFVDFFNGYPDIRMDVNFMIASGDTVMAHVTMSGTNSGSMGGMEPTNKRIEIDGVDVIVLKNGKCTEHWGYFEEAKMFTQLGLMPAAAAPADSMMSDTALDGE